MKIIVIPVIGCILGLLLVVAAFTASDSGTAAQCILGIFGGLCVTASIFGIIKICIYPSQEIKNIPSYSDRPEPKDVKINVETQPLITPASPYPAVYPVLYSAR